MHCVKLLSNNTCIDLSRLSDEDFSMLHYQEECYIANEAKKLPPFSKERNELLSKGYSLVHEIMNERSIQATGTTKQSIGSTKQTIKLLIKLIAEKYRKLESDDIIVYEAGVGTGYAIREVMNHPIMVKNGGGG